MGEMVFCRNCKTVVWAYDHIIHGVGNVVNMLKLPCSMCGEIGNFDSYQVKEWGWQEMKKRAMELGLTWDISGNLSWAGNGRKLEVVDNEN